MAADNHHPQHAHNGKEQHNPAPAAYNPALLEIANLDVTPDAAKALGIQFQPGVKLKDAMSDALKTAEGKQGIQEVVSNLNDSKVSFPINFQGHTEHVSLGQIAQMDALEFAISKSKDSKNAGYAQKYSDPNAGLQAEFGENYAPNLETLLWDHTEKLQGVYWRLYVPNDEKDKKEDLSKNLQVQLTGFDSFKLDYAQTQMAATSQSSYTTPVYLNAYTAPKEPAAQQYTGIVPPPEQGQQAGQAQPPAPLFAVPVDQQQPASGNPQLSPTTPTAQKKPGVAGPESDTPFADMLKKAGVDLGEFAPLVDLLLHMTHMPEATHVKPHHTTTTAPTVTQGKGNTPP